VPSVLWRCWLGGRKGIWPLKTEWWGAGVVICLERGAGLHMAQLMPLPLTVSCFSKIQIGFTFLVPVHPGSPGQRVVKRVCVCRNMCTILFSAHKHMHKQTRAWHLRKKWSYMSSFWKMWFPLESWGVMSTKFLYGQLLFLITTTKIAHRTSSFLHSQTDLLGKERRFFFCYHFSKSTIHKRSQP